MRQVQLVRSVLALSVMLGALLFSNVVQASLFIVATTPSMGVVVRAVTGDEAQVDVLAAPDRDAHTLNARPSMIARLRRADLVVAVGAQLEEGWLPAALDAAANPRLRPGQPGHFLASEHLHLRHTRFDPKLGGHVHADGNPHFNLSPLRMGELARVLAVRLGELRPSDAAAFASRAEAFAAQLEKRIPLLRARLKTPVTLIAYHEEFDYFSEWLPVNVIDFVEAKPGVPPTAAQLSRLQSLYRGQQGVLVSAVYQPQRASEMLGAALGWPTKALMLEPERADPEAYFRLLEHWVDALVGDE